MTLSEDERRERLQRLIAENDVQLSILLADLMVRTEQATAAFTSFGEGLESLLDASVASLSGSQRELYNALVACGTPMFDALCEAEELSEPSRSKD